MSPPADYFHCNCGPGSRGYPDARAPLVQAPLQYPVNPAAASLGSPPARWLTAFYIYR
jgi:hypothetical protein